MTDFLFGGMVQANTPINITSALVAANVSVTGTGLPTVGIFSPSTNQLGFATNSVQQMVIDTNGNMGLSTASPGVKLDVSGAGTMGRFTSSTTDSSIAFANSNGGTSTYIGNGGTNAFYVSTNGAERMRIDSSGNVGIGISSPAAKLDVRTAAGTAVTQYLYTGSSAAAATLQFAQVGNVGWNTGITAIGGHFQIGIDTGGLGYNINRNGLAIDYHSWLTAGAERMRIDANGNMGLGTSSPGSNSGLTTRLDVVTANGTATRIGLAQSGINSAGIVIPASVGGLAFEVGATERMRIDLSKLQMLTLVPNRVSIYKLLPMLHIIKIGIFSKIRPQHLMHWYLQIILIMVPVWWVANVCASTPVVVFSCLINHVSMPMRDQQIQLYREQPKY